MEKRDVAVTIQNLVQFYSIKNGIDGLIKKGYKVDIYVPKTSDTSGFGKMFDSTYDYLISLNYTPFRESDDELIYKILLEPYPVDEYIKINHKYRIKYKYSLLSAKPNLVYGPSHNIYYDAILCFGNYEKNILNVYSNAEIIGNLKYENIKKLNKPETDKKVLLYLPTYGNVSSIDSILEQLQQLKDKYYIITKLHHGTSYLQDEKDRTNKLMEISDECYNHKTELAELLTIADIVLSDNSGAIFETLYAKVPLAVYSEDINKNKLDNFDTTQYRLVKEGYIPYTNHSDEIPNILEQALSSKYIEKQKNLSDELFYRPENPVGCFVNVIEKYLNDHINFDYKKIHDVLVNDYTSKVNTISQLSNDLSALQNNSENLARQIEEKNTIISYYENGKLYRISKKIYNLYHKIFKRSKKNG